jgi:hypothetical protein
MRFADYDHDGQKTEFYLQTDAGPCGHTKGIVVGVSKINPRLHAFGTASKPNQPEYLEEHEWKALSNATHPIEVIDVSCGDHGAETELTVRLGWTAAGITVATREWTCPGGFKSGKLIRK